MFAQSTCFYSVSLSGEEGGPVVPNPLIRISFAAGLFRLDWLDLERLLLERRRLQFEKSIHLLPELLDLFGARGEPHRIEQILLLFPQGQHLFAKIRLSQNVGLQGFGASFHRILDLVVVTAVIATTLKFIVNGRAADRGALLTS